MTTASIIQRERARELRHNQTPAEKRIWRAMRERLPAVKLRRQVPLGPWIVDFAIVASRLVLEIDGETHVYAGAVERDQRRNQWLEEQGWRVVRFTNAQVMTNLDGVLMAIAALLIPPHPNPLPQGEGAADESPLPGGEGWVRGKPQDQTQPC